MDNKIVSNNIESGKSESGNKTSNINKELDISKNRNVDVNEVKEDENKSKEIENKSLIEIGLKNKSKEIDNKLESNSDNNESNDESNNDSDSDSDIIIDENEGDFKCLIVEVSDQSKSYYKPTRNDFKREVIDKSNINNDTYILDAIKHILDEKKNNSTSKKVIERIEKLEFFYLDYIPKNDVKDYEDKKWLNIKGCNGNALDLKKVKELYIEIKKTMYLKEDKKYTFRKYLIDKFNTVDKNKKKSGKEVNRLKNKKNENENEESDIDDEEKQVINTDDKQDESYLYSLDENGIDLELSKRSSNGTGVWIIYLTHEKSFKKYKSKWISNEEIKDREKKLKELEMAKLKNMEERLKKEKKEKRKLLKAIKNSGKSNKSNKSNKRNRDSEKSDEKSVKKIRKNK